MFSSFLSLYLRIQVNGSVAAGGGPGLFKKQQIILDHLVLLDQHIDKENNVLLPLAEKQLSEAKLAELSKGFERIEEQKIGVGKHEEFHKMIDQLESAYLK